MEVAISRTRLKVQVTNIADQFAITQDAVHSVIDCYLRYCRDKLMAGRLVDLFGLVKIVPDYITPSSSVTLAYECKKIASVLGLPQVTVYSIIDNYLNTAVSNVLNGTVVEIRSLVTIKPLKDSNGNLVKVHSSISQALRRQLQTVETPVTGFRVHTYKSLRNSVKEVGQG